MTVVKYGPLARSARGLLSDKRGVSLVEFAYTAPFLILLYIGGYQLTDGISAYRKVTTATRTIADLVSQCKQVTNDDLDTMLAASQQIMEPYDQAAAKITVTEVQTDSTGKSTVEWSRGRNQNGLVEGEVFNLPANIKQNDTSLIIAEIVYSYVPTVAPKYFGTIPMTDRMIMSPRQVGNIPRTGSCS